jgi:hypothetical protein
MHQMKIEISKANFIHSYVTACGDRCLILSPTSYDGRYETLQEQKQLSCSPGNAGSIFDKLPQKWGITNLPFRPIMPLPMPWVAHARLQTSDCRLR